MVYTTAEAELLYQQIVDSGMQLNIVLPGNKGWRVVTSLGRDPEGFITLTTDDGEEQYLLPHILPSLPYCLMETAQNDNSLL